MDSERRPLHRGQQGAARRVRAAGSDGRVLRHRFRGPLTERGAQGAPSPPDRRRVRRSLLADRRHARPSRASQRVHQGRAEAWRHRARGRASGRSSDRGAPLPSLAGSAFPAGRPSSSLLPLPSLLTARAPSPPQGVREPHRDGRPSGGWRAHLLRPDHPDGPRGQRVRRVGGRRVGDGWRTAAAARDEARVRRDGAARGDARRAAERAGPRPVRVPQGAGQRDGHRRVRDQPRVLGTAGVRLCVWAL
mmetsp:Transcript_16100/g.51621  ORF Transcript_16100/g.51621 Transcript_16100/m.51621 type:complete len:248 (-) Transcript_16100:1987-2730(-)